MAAGNSRRHIAGLESEGEDIRIVRLPVEDAIAKVNAGELADAKTVIAIQWLEGLLSETMRTSG